MSSLAVERGVQLPSVALVPDSAGSDGDDALFLSAAYGLAADPWQGRVVTDWLGRRQDGKWSSPRCGLAVPRQNGKNAAIEIRELYGMVGLGERILHTAHEVKTARKAFLRLCSFFENERQFPELALLVKDIRRTNGQEAIILHNGGSVEFIARSRSSGRGFSVDVLVLDEAQEASEEALAALLPTISASANPQLLLTGTPPSPTAVGEVFTRMRTAGVEGSEGRLCWLEWSCTEDAGLDDIGAWGVANPSLGVRLNVETIMDERSTMDDETFQRERLGVWVTDKQRSDIDQQRWVSLEHAEDSRPSPVALAVAVSADRAWTSICLAGQRKDGNRHVQVVQAMRGTAGVVERVVELRDTWGPIAVALDPAGPAASLQIPLEQAGVELTTVTGREVSAAETGFFDAVRDSTVRHSSQPALNIAVRAARKRLKGDSWVFRSNEPGTDIGPLKGVCLALYVLSKPVKAKRTGNVW